MFSKRKKNKDNMIENSTNANEVKNIAILFDTENVSPICVSIALDLAQSIDNSTVRVKKAYADWRNAPKSWADAVKTHGLCAVQQINHVKGKNSTDISMVIDAMELRLLGRANTFILCSSDCDFTSLASKIIETGGEFYAIGSHQASSVYKNACTKYICIEQELDRLSVQKKITSTQQAAHLKPLDIKLKIHQIVLALCTQKKTKISMNEIKYCIQESALDYKKCGYKTLKTLLQSFKELEFCLDDQKQTYITLKKKNISEKRINKIKLAH